MKLRKVCGAQRPSGTLTKFVKTDLLLQPIHRFSMVTSCCDVFTIAPTLVVPMDCKHFRHEGVPCL